MQKLIKSFLSRDAQSSSKEKTNLCEPCESIFRGQRKDMAPGTTAPHPFKQTLQELQTSAEAGCHLCYIRWNDLSPADREALKGCIKITFGFWESHVGNGIAFEYFYPKKLEGGKPCLTKSVLFMPVSEIPAFGNEDRVTIADTSDNEQTFNLGLSWIRKCRETHSYCNRSLPLPQSRFLPPRLLDVGTGPEISPRLCTATKELPVETPYMTLSHSWGGKVPLQLKLSNFEAFQDHIDPSTLPNTFRDAMKIVSKLGIRYLWIDSLCIIQDSTKDWNEQAAMMGDIYHNSWCNIAATGSTDPTGGCFKERSPLDVQPCKIEARWSLKPRKKFICYSFDDWDDFIEDRSLCHRAWVVQEFVLAPRVLHFGKKIFWQCLELRASETYPEGLPKYADTKISLDPHSLRGEILKARSIEFERYQLWCIFVNQYSGCAISKPDVDKLVAISGLARKLIGDRNQYVAGLWLNILPYQLMWSVSKDPEMMPGNSYIPSWSWASLNKRIIMRAPYFNNPSSSIIIRVLQLDVPLASNDPFGQIKSGGFLRLEGPILKTTIRPCIGLYNNSKWWLGSTLANVFADGDPFPDGTTIYCLTIELDISSTPNCRYGIVLQPTGKLPGQYYRRGYFAVFPLPDHERNVEDFVESHENLLLPEEYEDMIGVDSKAGLPFYRICIV